MPHQSYYNTRPPYTVHESMWHRQQILSEMQRRHTHQRMAVLNLSAGGEHHFDNQHVSSPSVCACGSCQRRSLTALGFNAANININYGTGMGQPPDHHIE